MNMFRIFVLLLLRQFCIGVKPPVLQISITGKDDTIHAWKNISHLMAKNELAFFKWLPNSQSEFGDEILNIKCTASYPIHWNIGGQANPLSTVNLRPVERDVRHETFTVSMNALAHTSKTLHMALKIGCEGLSNPEAVVYVYLFGSLYFQNIHLFKPDDQTYQNVLRDGTLVDTTELPCGTYSPEDRHGHKVTLYRLENQIETLLSNDSYVYNPMEGFYSSSGYWNGSFKCTQGSNFLTFLALDSSSNANVKKSYYFPDRIARFSFTDDAISLVCKHTNLSATSFQVLVSSLVGIFMPKIGLRWENDTGRNLIISRTPVGRTLFIKASLKNVPENVTFWMQNVSCVDTYDETNSKLWDLQFYLPPVLELDNIKRRMSCLGHERLEMTTIQCSNRMDCNYKKRCFHDTSSCGTFVAHAWEDFESKCLSHPTTNYSCSVSIPYTHYSGIVQCEYGFCDGCPLSRQWEFFQSLDLILYSSWMNAGENELLRFDETPHVLYVNGTTTFTCQAVAFLFANSLTFELEFANKSKILLDNDTIGVEFRVSDEDNPRRIENLNFLQTIEISLPPDAAGIYCLAPWGNSTDVMRIKKKFQTRYLRDPHFIDGNGESAATTFTAGLKNYRLDCPVRGEPLPEYKWFYNGENILIGFPELKASVGSEGQGYLVFPPIQDAASGSKYIGTFTCEAINSVGTVRRNINLNVEEQNTSVAVYAPVIALPLCLLLAAIVALLVLMVRRYRILKELRRSLTNAEIDEFFNGRPDLLGNASATGIELVDFLPFRSDYEISKEDLSYGELLGHGHFSFVFKGKILSKSMDVAVKTVKADTDVNFFKTFLSEVKILMFIGEHENIVKLVGVCTEDIRNRSIVIATEICELGSLDNLLIACRNNFIDLINENQMINGSLFVQTGTQCESEFLTTLDLLALCMQLASGMTYLANKSVIHADLACRNVLIKADKTVKISDFGLSKKMYQCDNYVKRSKTPLPWRWMALESLTTMTFSTKSDVWSYGVTLYEIFSLGGKPFPNEEWTNEFVTRLSSGMRMGRPKYCTPEIYSKIVACWEEQPEQRPDFPSLHEYFLRLFNKYNTSELNAVISAARNAGKENSSITEDQQEELPQSLHEDKYLHLE